MSAPGTPKASEAAVAAVQDAPPEPVYGYCTACGSVEVKLDKATGTRDFSNIGEAADYPTGYGCEVCG